MTSARPNPARNDRVAYLIAGVPIVAGWLQASNRPVFWAFWGFAIGALAAIYFFRSARMGLPLRSGQFRAILLAGAVMILWSAIQIIPFGWVPALPAVFAELSTISVDPQTGVIGLMRLVTYALLFVLTVEVATRESRIRRVLQVVFLGILAQAVFAILALKIWGDYAPWHPKQAYFGFATGSFINRNSLAMYLGMGACIGVGLAFDQLRTAPASNRFGKPHTPGGRVEAGAYLAATVVLLTTQLATGSRMGLFSTIAGLMLIYVLMRWKAGHGIGGSLIRLIAVGMPALLVMALIFGGETLDRGINLLASNVDRLVLWEQALPMITDRPLTGFGLDSFEIAFRPYHQEGLSAGVVWDFAHNTYLDLWIELGVVAGTMPLICVALAGWFTVRCLRGAETDYMRSVVCLGVILQCAIHAVVDFGLETEANVLLFVILAGLGVAKTKERIAA